MSDFLSKGRALIISMTMFFFMMLAMLFAITILALFSAIIAAVVIAFTVLCLVTWHVFAVIPAVLNEVNGFAACVIFGAMLAPVLGVTRRNMQIYGLTLHWYPLNNAGLLVNYPGTPVVAYVQRPVITGLTNID